MAQFLLSFVSIFFNLIFWAVFISVLLSWFASGRSQLGVWLEQIVRPILWPFRWARIGMIDFSPVLALVVLDFLRGAVVDLLVRVL